MSLTTHLPVIYFRLIIAAASRNPQDPARLMEGVSPLEGGVTVEDYRQLIRNARRVSGNACVLLDAGISAPITAHGVLSNAFGCSPHRMAILELLTRFSKLRSFFVSFDTRREGNRTRCVITIDSTLGEEADDALDFILGTLMASVMFRELAPMSTPHIQLTRSQSAEHAHYAQVLGASISYDERDNCIVFDTDDLEHPLPTHDAEQYSIAVEKCRALFTSEPSFGSTREAIERVFDRYPGVIWTTGQIASQLHVSARTMQRRLRDEGTSYQEILDNWLKSLALMYLEGQNLTVEATATLLGYNDEANFRRAFKRWFGCSPRAYRSRAGKV